MGDSLDLPSAVYIEVTDGAGNVTQKELTFRELHEHCKSDITLWDSLSEKTRLAVQRANDPHYKAIKFAE